jgi:transcriptional regulator GlxA family with amidase domain
MEQNLDFPLSLNGLSDQLDLPKRSLARLTESVFGVSPMRLHLRVRLQAARNLLFYEEHAIRDIATACGFSYPAAFSRGFRAQFSFPPSEFRRSLRDRQASRVQPELHQLVSVGREGGNA